MLEIGQHQLGLDRLGVRDGIDAALHMGHVTVLETAQDVGDGVDLADIGEELVAETLALGRAFHEARDIDEGHPRGNDLLRLRDPGQLVEPGSGTATSPTLGSIVQKGKFAACAAAVRVSALKSVDLPTFGRPTIPTLKPMVHSHCQNSPPLKGYASAGQPNCEAIGPVVAELRSVSGKRMHGRTCRQVRVGKAGFSGAH
jgi:hypothetical protein